MNSIRALLLLIWSLTIISVAADAKSDLRDCLNKAVNGDKGRVAWHTKFLFDLTDVKRYNLYYDVDPLAITYPETDDEVSSIVVCAANGNFDVQARSGGHSFGNYGLGGDNDAVVVDTKYLDQLSYDEKDQTAHIGPGNGLKDVNDFLLEYGRLASHGDAPQVGVGGHYTIGGLGRISRQFGAACDNILSATVVLANGTITTASSTTNPDLFFALRGAGASFGIVTDFHIRTHPTPGTTIAFTYNITLGSSTAHATAFKQWQKLITSPTLPREFSTQFIALPGVSVITGFYYGTEKQFSSLNLDAQFSGFSAKDIRVVDPAVAVAHDISELGLKLFGDVPAHFYSKSLSFTNKTLLSDDAVDAMFNYLGDLDLTVLAVPWFVIFDLEGGAINDMPPDETAYAFRDTLFFLQSYAIDLLGAFRAETRRFLDGLNEVVIEQGEKEGLRGWGSYPGYVDPYLEGSREMYWGGNYGELRKVKRKWDSEQVFRNPQSVEPADA